MNDIHFYLLHPKGETSSIGISVYFRKKRFRFSSGENVSVKFWNVKKGRAKETQEYEDCYYINKKLNDIEISVRSILQDYSLRNTIPTVEVLKKKLNNDYTESVYFTDYIRQFISQVNRSANTKKRYVTTLNNILSLEKETKKRYHFTDINMKFYNGLQKWFNENGFSSNYFGDCIKNIKVFFRSAESEGLHNITLPSKFKMVTEDSDSIYLTNGELLKLHNLNINEDFILDNVPATVLNVSGGIERMIKSLIDCRDRFLIGAYTAMRFSDYAFLKNVKYTDEFISRTSQKTGIKTVIPMHPVIREILQRRNNVLPPSVSNQKMNARLKVLGRLAGIVEDVEITKVLVKGKERTIYKKYELITTHTARRSGCTNMYLAGIDPISIMSFSGHKTVKSFMKYIKASQQETAERLKNHPFFK